MTFTLRQGEPIEEVEPSLLIRAKRLTVALFRLTSYFEPNEPIRENIRAKATFLLDTALNLKDMRKPLNELLSFTDVLLYSGLVSETNAKILKDELVSLTNQARQIGIGETSPFWGLNDLIPDSPQIFGKHSGGARGSGDLGLATAATQIEAGSQKDKRQQVIVNFIRKTGGANVRDLMAVVRGCSEKTIQRELALLIARGELRREGERRWSKYLPSLES